MPFNLKELNPTAKFYCNKKEWVELRNIPPSEIRNMRRECRTEEVEYYQPEGYEGQPYRYEVAKVDDDKLFDMMWDYQIVNWYIVDADNNEIPCTKENKLIMMTESVDFADFIVQSLNKLAKDTKLQREKSEKNLKRSRTR